MNAQSFPLRWQVLLGFFGLVLICMSALGTATAVSEAPSPRPTEGTKAVVADTQHIALEEGWNLVSSRLIPDDPSIEAVFASIAEAVEVVRDESGDVYRPSDGTNTIGTWDVQEAYSVYVSSPQTLIIEGTPPTASEAEISLQDGWNTVSYLPDTTHSPTEALTSIEESLVMAKDGKGNAFVSDEDVDQLEQLRPGEGFKVYVSSPQTLSYPDPPLSSTLEYPTACSDAPRSVLVGEYGSLTPGARADSSQRVANLEAINAAISNAPAGGAVCLPDDSLFVTFDKPPQTGNPGNYHIRINRDSVTVWGAGGCGWGDLSGCSYIGTPGDADSYWYKGDIDNDGTTEVIRGTGIGYTASAGADSLRSLTLKGFEIDGNAGYTGNFNFNYYNEVPEAEDGWDLSHKGISFSGGGDDMTDILIEDIEVHRYRGEVIYNGGFQMGVITARRIWSHDSNGSAWNVATAKSQLVEDSKFGPNVRFWGELLAEGIPDATSIHRNNTYEDCNTGNGCLAIALDTQSNIVQGQTWTWENNTLTIDGSNTTQRHFLLTAAPANINIINNDIQGGTFWVANSGAGSETATLDVSGNTYDAKSADPFLFQSGTYKGTIKNNTITNNGSVYTASGASLGDLSIVANTFGNEEDVSTGGGGPPRYAYFSDNTYKNAGAPHDDIFRDQVVKTYVQRKAFNASNDYNLELEAKAADGQSVWLFGGQKSVTFPADSPNHAWSSDFTLSSPSDSVQVMFNRSSATWELVE